MVLAIGLFINGFLFDTDKQPNAHLSTDEVINTNFNTNPTVDAQRKAPVATTDFSTVTTDDSFF
ncbi:hypothetical protein SDC9_72893 [bioreactor metagenome]|uniref:Uncharacterized protein n=1 Tax=bioreactor metagenome TaxID=1076179 RepID=A0A644YCM3_9ZZZZ